MTILHILVTASILVALQVAFVGAMILSDDAMVYGWGIASLMASAALWFTPELSRVLFA